MYFLPKNGLGLKDAQAIEYYLYMDLFSITLKFIKLFTDQQGVFFQRFFAGYLYCLKFAQNLTYVNKGKCTFLLISLFFY